MYSWHSEVFTRTLRQVSSYVKHNYPKDGVIGWIGFFKENHPEAYKKYITLEDDIHKVSNDTSAAGHEKFKDLCDQYKDSAIWAISKYVHAQREIQKAEAEKGQQEVLAL